MEFIDELKLEIYESVLDEEDKADLLDIVESTDDDEVLESVIEVLEASKEEADKQAKYGKNTRENKKSFVQDELNDSRYDNLDYVRRRKEAMRSGKYGSQYDKMTDDEKRRRDILLNSRTSFIGRERRGEKKERGKKDSYLDRRSTFLMGAPSDINKKIDLNNKNRSLNLKHSTANYKILQAKESDIERYYKGKERDKRLESLRSSYDKAEEKLNKSAKRMDNKSHLLFTKGQIIKDMKDKYENDPEKLDKVKSIRAKYGHTLESSY